MKDPAPAKPRLSVRHLSVHFRPRGLLAGVRQGRTLAVDDLHLDLRNGEIIGFVGESGCGKTALAQALAGLIPMTGSVRCDGDELAAGKDRAAQQTAIQLLPTVALEGIKPRKRVNEIVAEPLRARYPKLDVQQRDAHVAALLTRVGVPADWLSKPLKELTPAQKARIALARALCVQPKVLLCDVPDARLDEIERAAYLDLVIDLADQLDLALILFAREPAALRAQCSRLLTMTLGKIMEQAPTDALLDAPRHPYTRALLAQTMPDAGAPPPLQHPPMGCVFHPRCPLAEAACVRTVPHLRRVGPEHYAACHFVGESV